MFAKGQDGTLHEGPMDVVSAQAETIELEDKICAALADGIHASIKKLATACTVKPLRNGPFSGSEIEVTLQGGAHVWANHFSVEAHYLSLENWYRIAAHLPSWVGGNPTGDKMTAYYFLPVEDLDRITESKNAYLTGLEKIAKRLTADLEALRKGQGPRQKLPVSAMAALEEREAIASILETFSEADS